MLAGVFVFSAATKIQSADLFEVYIYQLGLFSFDWSAWTARLVIGAELVIAFGFLSKLYFKTIWQFAVLVLLIASGFLIYQITLGNVSNCFCFGELVSMSPSQSLLKNVAILALLLALRKVNPLQIRFSFILFVFSTLLAIATPVILSPPDNLIPSRISAAEMDAEAMKKAFSEHLLPEELLHGNKLICFYSTSCRYCQLSSTRMSAAFSRYDLNRDILHTVFLLNSEQAIDDFLDQTRGIESSRSVMNSSNFLGITKGRMPLIMLMSDGKVEKVWNYRQIDEDVLVNFLSSSPN